MSRLTGLGRKKKDDKPKEKGGRSLTIVLLGGSTLATLIVVILVAAIVFTLVSSKTVTLPAMGGTTTTSTTSTTSTTTTSVTVPTTTLPIIVVTTSSTLPPTTVTTSTTTTTINKYQIAACMADGVYELFLSDNVPSQRLELYLGEYDVLFSIRDCRTNDDKEDCRRDLEDFLEDDDLVWYDGRVANSPNYYPVAAYRGKAYILPSPRALEELLNCGSLEGD